MAKEDAQAYCEQNGLVHFEVSAKKNMNIQELFITIAQKIPVQETVANPGRKKLDTPVLASGGRRCLCM